MFDVNVSLTKSIGYILFTSAKEFPTKKEIKDTLALFPFLDKKERYNIFSNVLRILFDLPSMNFHFLKFIQPRCEKVDL